VDVVEGILKIGTPIVVPSKDNLVIGIVESIEINKNKLNEARKKTGSVAIRIKTNGKITHGKQFDLED
jgi:translation initiation factor 5B